MSRNAREFLKYLSGVIFQPGNFFGAAMTNNYDSIARYYDFLSSLVFGQSQRTAQRDLLPWITPKSTILIAGGGSGLILEEIGKIHPEGLRIIYVEISANMINMAKRRNCFSNEVTFINQPIETYKTCGPVDFIMTPFLLDNFHAERIQHIINQLGALLPREGKWLFTDFHLDKENGKWWQKVLLFLMYRFFRVVSHTEAHCLPPLQLLFDNNGYIPLARYTRFCGFIQSIVYQRPLAQLS